MPGRFFADLFRPFQLLAFGTVDGALGILRLALGTARILGSLLGLCVVLRHGHSRRIGDDLRRLRRLLVDGSAA